MDIREKIKEIIYHDSDVDKVLDLIRQEVSEAIPNEERVADKYCGCDGECFGACGASYNRCLSDIRSAFKEKGLI